MQEITTQTFEEATNGNMCLLDFVTPWCQPCRVMVPMLEDIEEETKVPIFRINVDTSPELAERFRITNVPYLIVYSDGEVKEKLIGLHSKSDIIKMIKSAAVYVQ